MTIRHTANSITNFIVRAIHLLTTCCGVTAALLLAVACLVVCEMVIARYLFDSSTYWQTEFVTFCVVAATLIGSPYVLKHKGHVNMDLLPQKLPPLPRRWLELVTSIFAFSVCIVIAWSGSIYLFEAWEAEWTTESVWGPPLWIPLLSLPVGLGMLSLQYLADILECCRAILQGQDPAAEQGDESA